MKSPSEYVTLVEVLELLRPFDEVGPVVENLLGRLEVEGIAALISMQFYLNEEKTEIGAVITFSDSNQLIEHTRMISSWEEFKRFTSMVKLADMRVHGTLSAEAEAWIRQFQGPLKKFAHYLAGFVR